MSMIDNGGPAFPRPMTVKDEDSYIQDHGDFGMSLRDWFAGKALAGLLTHPNMFGDPAHYAVVAYRYADAMLVAREKG